MIEVVPVLRGMHAPPDDGHVGVGLVVVAHVVGVRVWGVTLPFSWVTGPNEPSTSVVQSNVVWSVGGVAGVPDKESMLAKSDGGSLGPLWHLFTLGWTNGVRGHASLV